MVYASRTSSERASIASSDARSITHNKIHSAARHALVAALASGTILAGLVGIQIIFTPSAVAQTRGISSTPAIVPVGPVPAITPAGPAPTALANPDVLLETRLGTEFRYAVSESDSSFPNETVAVIGLPTWARFDPATATIRGTPLGRDFGPDAHVTVVFDESMPSERRSTYTLRIVAAPAGISNTTPSTLEWDRVQVGEQVFVDDATVFTRVPGELRTLPYLKTENARQFESGNAAIEFDVDRPVRVLVGFDVRIDVLPSWLAGWHDTGLEIETGSTSRKLLARSFDTGRISLGGNENGFSMYTVIVDDGTGYGNSPPEFASLPPQSGKSGEEISFFPEATDIDGDRIDYGVEYLPRWLTLDSRTGEIFGTPSAGDTDPLAQVTISATDGRDTTIWRPFSAPAGSKAVTSAKGSLSSLMTTAADFAPTLSGVPPSHAFPDDYYRFTALATDPNGDLLKFRIENRPRWAWFNDRTGYLAGKPGDRDIGIYDDVRIQVTDGEFWAELQPFSIAVSREAPAQEPEPTGTPAVPDEPEENHSPSLAEQSQQEDDASQDPPPSDEPEPANDPLPPANDPAADPVSDDPRPPYADGETPTISGSPLTYTRPGEHYGFTTVASDPNGDRLKFRIENRPRWAWFNDRTGFMGGRPMESHVGTYENILISVTDGDNWAQLPAFSITVGIGDPPPGAEEPSRDETPSQQNDGHDPGQPDNPEPGDDQPVPPADPVELPAESDPPALAPAHAPAPAPAPAPTPSSDGTTPTISGSPVTYIRPGDTYSFTAVASDPNGDRLKFRIENRPRWAWFNDRTGYLSGRPRSRDIGTHEGIRISVTDGENWAQLPEFSVTIGTSPPPANDYRPTSGPSLNNTPPTIAGSPAPAVLPGQVYTFRPDSHDADGDPLTFSIDNRPPWAVFSEDDGHLSGTPGPGDLGSYDDIAIEVSDGEAAATLATFSIVVAPTGSSSMVLEWIPPTERMDGSPLTDLAGFTVYWGSSADNFTNSVRIDNPSVTSYVVDNLTPGVWHFTVTAFDSSSRESDFSNGEVLILN